MCHGQVSWQIGYGHPTIMNGIPVKWLIIHCEWWYDPHPVHPTFDHVTNKVPRFGIAQSIHHHSLQFMAMIFFTENEVLNRWNHFSVFGYGNPETNRTGICQLLCGKPNAIHLTQCHTPTIWG